MANGWAAQLSVVGYDTDAGTTISGSEVATALGCTISFTIPSSGDYLMVISNPDGCGNDVVETGNGTGTLTCSGDVACCGAVFTDSGGLFSDYQDDENNTYTICPDNANEVITSNFSVFNVEDINSGGCWDVMNIYDGNSTAAPLIGEYCDTPGGPGSPGTITSTAPDGCLTFEFISDESINFDGWEAFLSCSPAASLSVEWLSFTAQLDENNKGLLKWTTANEKDNDYFVIERSFNGRDFVKMGEVAAKGNSSISQNYSFIDVGLVPGSNYYRIKQVDFSGKFTYSEIKLLTLEGSIFSVQPNPTKDELRLFFDLEIEEEVVIEVYNTAGQLLFAVPIVNQVGGIPLSFSAMNIESAGIYWIKAKTTTRVLPSVSVVKIE